jgi:hypothetical protein
LLSILELYAAKIHDLSRTAQVLRAFSHHPSGHSTTMPRLSATPILTLHRSTQLHLRPSFTAHFASTNANEKGTQNSRPGWSGRPAEDHATQRDRLDAQGDASQEGMKKFQEDQDQNTKTVSGQAITREDERNANRRAKEEHPEAPGPVIGMNDERGSVSAFVSMVS